MHASRRILSFAPPTHSEDALVFFSQIARLELGQGAVDEEAIREGITFIDSRQDCCDFAAGGMLHILYQYHASPLLSRTLIRDIEACLLNFKY